MTQSLPPRTAETVLAHLRSAASQLGPAEKRVAEALVTSFDSIAHTSAAQIAQEAATSAATVVRACQRLGYSGFQELRVEIARYAYATERDNGRHGSESAASHDASEALISQVFSTAVSDLKATSAMLDRNAFTRAVSILASAETIVLVGSGESAIPAQDAALRFTMGGRTAIAPADTLSQQFTARLLGPLDACIAVSYSGANRHTLDSVSAAHSAGAQVIAVTSSGLSPLAEQADAILVTGSPTAQTEVLVTRIAHTLVLNALNLAVQQHSGEPTFGPSQDLTEVFARTLETDTDQ